jgi:hypothetical protein
MRRADRGGTMVPWSRGALLSAIVCMLLALPSLLLAQAKSAGPPVKDGQRAAASMEQIVQFVTSTAYRGIAITDDQRQRARSIIITATQEQQRLDTTRPDFVGAK